MHPDPVATYRLQLRNGVGFEQAAAVIPYLADLGISHVYLSPYLQAAEGSTHGYDVVDPTRVDEELGGEKAHARLRRALDKAQLGQMLDIVPNHMAIVGRQNPWWWDVLENGPSSRYAVFFDVDWEASEERWSNKVLLPVLGDHYGRVLEAKELCLVHNAGLFVLHYYDNVFPVDPSSLREVLMRAAEAADSDYLGFIADSFARLPRPTATGRRAVRERHRDTFLLQRLLTMLCSEEPRIVSAIDEVVERINADPDMLDTFIDGQNYRLALWRTAGRDLGYRRFFDINDLAGLRVEEEDVFQAVHTLPLSWVQEGTVHGLRVDHPDGLRDPAQYFQRLHYMSPKAWIVAEKILEPGETIPGNWPIAGTTGYDFLNLVGGLLIDPSGEKQMTETYRNFTGNAVEYSDCLRGCKRQVLHELLGSEVRRLTALFVDICERHRRHRDYTRQQLQEALIEMAVAFPVYRTYVSATSETVTESDIKYVTEAVNSAISEREDLDAELFRFLGDILLLRVGGSLENELAMRFQQLTGPAMAKGGEDTAFYRYNRMVSLNEVGGYPARFGTAVEEFHQSCRESFVHHPMALLATSTHDTKRSEDVRARLAVLSEIPERWSERMQRWGEHNKRYRESGLFDRNTEYLFYQSLVGAWPVDEQRMLAYMEKAVRESKEHTSWTRVDETYEEAVRNFVSQVMHDRKFCKEVEEFVASIATAGWVNSLAQTLIKCTVPGVPDIYQGTELWDLSLVDPDNRRRVDFEKRALLLSEIDRLSCEEIVGRMEEGLPKLWVIVQSLRLRRRRPELFGPEGDYGVLSALGEKAHHVVAFVRGEGTVTVAPRLMVRRGNGWGETAIKLPPGRWRNILTGDMVDGGIVGVEKVLKRFPVGLLEREE